MAIQGIIQGFADPADLSKNVILVGRGADYVLLIDGESVAAYPKLPSATPVFLLKARELCKPHWLQVKDLRSNNVNSKSEVVAVGGCSYEHYEPADTF